MRIFVTGVHELLELIVVGLELRKQLSSNTLAIAELESVGLEGAVQDTAIRTLASEIDRKKISAIKKILDSGADPNLADKFGCTALHWMLRLFWRPKSRSAQRPSSTHEQLRSPIYTFELLEMDVNKSPFTHGGNVKSRNFPCGLPLAAAVRRGFVEGTKVLMGSISTTATILGKHLLLLQLNAI